MLKPYRLKPFLYLSLLLPCLGIYLCYRSPKTLVSELFMQVFSPEIHEQVAQYARVKLPLPEWVIFALPEALWIFCISYFSGAYYLLSKHAKLIYLPIFLVFWFEILQALHWLNGSFDWVDLGLSSMAWLLAYWGQRGQNQEDLFRALNLRKYLCIGLYAVVYLAHVLHN